MSEAPWLPRRDDLGDPVLVELRQAWLDAQAEGEWGELEVSDTQMLHVFHGFPLPEQLARAARRLGRAACAASRPAEPLPAHLVRLARLEGCPAFTARVQALALSALRRTPAAHEVARAALTHPFAEARLAAARYLGPEGAGTLRELVSAQATSDEVRAGAWDALAAHEQPGSLGALARELGASEARDVADGALDAMILLGIPPGVERVGWRLARAPIATAARLIPKLPALGPAYAPVLGAVLERLDLALSRSAVEALQAMGELATLEQGLLRQLEDPLLPWREDEIQTFVRFSLDTLGALGTRACLARLRAVFERAPSALTDAFEAALGALQERPGGTAGALALAEIEQGGLALAPQASGGSSHPSSPRRA